LRSELDILLDYLRATDCKATFPLEQSAEELLQASLPELLDSGVVHCFEAGIEPVYNVVEDKALDAAYYRNNAIHFLFTGGIADLALAKLYIDGCGDEPLQDLEEEVLQLRKLFQWEFFFPEKEEFLEGLYRDLDIRHSEWRELTAKGKDGLHQLFRELSPLLGHGALEPYLESYRIVSEQLLEHGSAEDFDQKAFINDCLNIGRQLLDCQVHVQHRAESGQVTRVAGYQRKQFRTGQTARGARRGYARHQPPGARIAFAGFCEAVGNSQLTRLCPTSNFARVIQKGRS
jgi:glycerol-3-phosphate O-acyltransferase